MMGNSLHNNGYPINAGISVGIKSGIFGSVDECDAQGASGWIMDAGNLYACPEVKIKIGKLVLASGCPSFVRPDISAIMGTPAKAGFKILWDKAAILELKKFCQSSPIEARAYHGDREILAANPLIIDPDAILASQASLLKGTVSSIRGPFIRGTIDASCEQASLVNLLIDNQIVASCISQYVEGKEVEDNFLLIIPPDIFNGKTHSAKVCFGDGSSLENGEILINGSRIGEGRIDRIDEKGIHGWAWSWLKPFGSAYVELLVNGRSQGLFEAKGKREDVGRELGTNGFNAFWLPLPPKADPMEVQEIEVRILGSEAPLPPGKMPLPCFPDETQDITSNPRHDIIGCLESVERGACSGWTVDQANPGEISLIDVFLNGNYIGSARADLPRPDLCAASPSGLKYGFRFEFPWGISLEDADVIQCRVRDTGACLSLAQDFKFEKRKFYLRYPVAITCDASVSSRHLEEAYCPKPSATAQHTSKPCIEIIVLDRDGISNLDTLFSSFLEFNSWENLRFAILDHSSSRQDSSRYEKWAPKFPIRIFRPSKDFSQMASRNAAALSSEADLLLFLDGDIAFCQDILTGLVDIVSKGTAIVGLKIQNGVLIQSEYLCCERADEELGSEAGVFFSWNSPSHSCLPFSLPGAAIADLPREQIVKSPALSVSAMMVKRASFLKMGGFDPHYATKYGDLALCFQAYDKNRDSIVCANHLCVIRPGEIQSSARPRDFKGERDFAHFRESFGFWLKGRRREDWFTPHKEFSIERNVIAFLLPEEDGALSERDREILDATTQILERNTGIRVLRLHGSERPSLVGVDVAIITWPGFYFESIEEISPYTRIIGWIPNSAGAWLQKSWLDRLDIIITRSQTSKRLLDTHVDCAVELLPPCYYASPDAPTASPHKHEWDYIVYGDAQSGSTIMADLQPYALPFRFAVFGKGWDATGWLPFWKGAEKRPHQVFPSSKLIIPESGGYSSWQNIFSSPVLDALMGGALVVVKDRKYSEEFFEGLLPWYEDSYQLHDLIKKYLSDENKRIGVVEKLQELISQKYSFQGYIDVLSDALENVGKSLRAFIEVQEDGDRINQFMAGIIKRKLRGLGHLTRLRAKPDIERSLNHGDDLHIAIGASDFSADPTTLSCCISFEPDQTRQRRHLGKYDYRLVQDENARMNLALPDTNILEENTETIISYNNRGEWEIRNPLALCKRLEQWVEYIIQECLKRQSTFAPRKPIETANASGLIDSGVTLLGWQRKPHVIYWPNYTGNPYLRLLYEGLADAFDIKPGTIEDAIQLAESGEQVAFHLHWIDPVLGRDCSHEETRHRIEFFIKQIESFLKNKGILVWTIHNARSHECRYPDLEALLYQHLAELASSIHLHSSIDADFLPEINKIVEKKLIIGPHGNYIGAYPPQVRTDLRQRLGIPKNARLFLFLGAIREYKGVPELMDAFRRLWRQSGTEISRRVFLLIAGRPQGEDAYVLSRDLPEHCVLDLRRIPDEEICEYLAEADFVVLPYKRILTSGAALLALSFNVPVIAPRLGDLPKVLTDGKNAMLYDSLNPMGLEGALRAAALLNDESLRAMKQAAGEAARKYSWLKVQDSLSRAYAATSGAEWKIISSGKVENRFLIRRPANMSFARVAIAIIHFGDIGDTIRAVASVIGQGTIYVISNDPDARAFVDLCDRFPEIVVIQAPENLYYAGANNVLLKLIQEDKSVHSSCAYEYVLLMNNDVELEANSVELLAVNMDTDRRLAFGSPCLVFGDAPDRIWFCGAEIDWESESVVRHLHWNEKVGGLIGEPIESDYISGACLMARLNAVEDIGPLSEDYGMYFEDTDWSIRARQAGWRLQVFPGIIGRHFKRSEHNSAPSDLYMYYYARNIFLFAAIHSPDHLINIEKSIRKTSAWWLERVRTHEPERSGQARITIEKAINDGKQIAQEYLAHKSL